MHSPLPLTRDLVLLGGGHAHALLLRRWGMRPLPGVRVTLVSPAPTAPYTGMLPGAVAGHFPPDALEIDLIRLARFAGARFIPGTAEGIDRAAATVRLSSGRSLRYDRLSLNVGVTASAPEIPGYAAHVVPARPLADLVNRWEEVVRTLTPGDAPQIVVIGAGVGGVELALALDHRLKQQGTPARQITLIDRGPAMPDLASAARRHLELALREAHISLILNTNISEISATEVLLETGKTLPADLIIGTTGARPHGWLADTGLALADGFVTVDPYLRSTSDPAIYAAGDCAHLRDTPRPKAGIYAVRAASILAHNLAADLSGRGRRMFRPQSDFLRLIGTGGPQAVAAKWGLALRGAWAWRWKERIDTRFMDRLGADLRPMPAPTLLSRTAAGVREAVSGPPPCNGCGAKVGQTTLAQALANLPNPNRADVSAAPGDDAARISLNGAELAITTDHLRAITPDEALFARIAAHHALGDIYAMGASPQLALASVILPPMTPALQSDTLRSIMAAAAEVFTAAGAAIAGGHTSEGAELTLGFTVTGRLDRPTIGLSGACPGDVLLLTRPLGSGTLLAAEMALKARGRDITALFDEMCISQTQAAEILQGAHAMTDVTGFGLAGHLANICRASGLGARIDLAQVPLFSGAKQATTAGIRSSLFPANRSAVPELDADSSPEATLLFDPQTAGGLLAAIDPQQAPGLLASLRSAGYGRAAAIGQITEGPPKLSLC